MRDFICYLAGFFSGGMAGIFSVALMQAARRNDDEEEQRRDD